MDKREWGRRYSDDQPYPKTRDKDVLPTGLTPIARTRRERRVAESSKRLVKALTVSDSINDAEDELWNLGQRIQEATSMEEAHAIQDEILQTSGAGLANLVWDEYVDWDKAEWEGEEYAGPLRAEPSSSVPLDFIEPSLRGDSMIPLDTAKGLRVGTILYSKTLKNADGSPQRWRVNGKVQRWKRQPDRIKIPIKRGLREFDYFTNDNLGDFTLTESNVPEKKEYEYKILHRRKL